MMRASALGEKNKKDDVEANSYKDTFATVVIVVALFSAFGQ
jgi:hypothetical protein